MICFLYNESFLIVLFSAQINFYVWLLIRHALRACHLPLQGKAFNEETQQPDKPQFEAFSNRLCF